MNILVTGTSGFIAKKLVKESLGRIQKTANQILDEIENGFEI